MDSNCCDILVLSEINIDSLKVWKAHTDSLRKKSTADKHFNEYERLNEDGNVDGESESGENEEMNESMDYIPHTSILRRVSAQHGDADDFTTLTNDDEIHEDNLQPVASPMAHRPILSKQGSTFKQRRFSSYLKSRGRYSVDCLDSISAVGKPEQDIYRKIDSLGKLLDERTYQKAESNAHYQAILEGMSKQLEVCQVSICCVVLNELILMNQNQGNFIAKLCQNMEQLKLTSNKTKYGTTKADVGDLEKVMEAIADLQMSLNVIKDMIRTSSAAPNNQITTLSDTNAKLIENNISLRQTFTALGKYPQGFASSQLIVES